MRTEFTAPYLIDAIREADSLEELQRMVGASDSEHDKAQKRLDEIDRIWERSQKDNWPANEELWPYPFGERYKRLIDEQTEFENKYC